MGGIININVAIPLPSGPSVRARIIDVIVAKTKFADEVKKVIMLPFDRLIDFCWFILFYFHQFILIDFWYIVLILNATG